MDTIPCFVCFTKVVKEKMSDVMVFGKAEFTLEEIECACEKTLHEYMVEKVEDNVYRTNNWKGDLH